LLRVPDTFQLGAILQYRAFLASQVFNNLRVFNTREYSDSFRLHHVSQHPGIREPAGTSPVS